MSAHVLLNLLNALGEKDKISSFADFPNEFYKFNNTGT